MKTKREALIFFGYDNIGNKPNLRKASLDIIVCPFYLNN